jgi:hypothetical protein
MPELTMIPGRGASRDLFPDVPLLAGRLGVLEDLSRLSIEQLDLTWTDVYRFRYFAVLVVGDNPLARPRLDALREYQDRLESARGQAPLDVNADHDWVNRETLGGGPDHQVERTLDEDASIPEDFLLEHLPVYSSGSRLLFVIGARAYLSGYFAPIGRLVTVGDWRNAKSEQIRREIHFRYYGSGALARDDIAKYILPASLKEMTAAYRAAQR